MRIFIIIGILTLVGPFSFTFAAEDDALETGPTAAEVAAFKKSNLSFTVFTSFANEFEGEGTSSGAGSDGQFTSFHSAENSFGIGVNYTALRFWRMRFDVGLQIENGRSISKERFKGETATVLSNTSLDVDMMYSLVANFYYPLARKFELWTGVNFTQISIDDPSTELDPDLGYQAGVGYNWSQQWTTELGYFSKRVTGVRSGTPQYPFDHLELNGFLLFLKYYH